MQPRLPTVAASIAYGCSLHYLRLQALARREVEVATLRGMLLIADADVAALGEFHGHATLLGGQEAAALRVQLQVSRALWLCVLLLLLGSY